MYICTMPNTVGKAVKGTASPSVSSLAVWFLCLQCFVVAFLGNPLSVLCADIVSIGHFLPFTYVIERVNYTPNSELHSCSIITCFIDYLKSFFKNSGLTSICYASHFAVGFIYPWFLCDKWNSLIFLKMTTCSVLSALCLPFSKYLHKTGTY